MLRRAMVTTDPRVDSYIEKAAAFAQPILRELRARVHATCPDAVETVKWRMPAFEFQGLLAGMAAFKAHCTFGFWKDRILRRSGGDAALLDQLGCLKLPKDLPGKAAFAKAMKAAMQLNAEHVPAPRAKTKRKPIAMHPAFGKALAASKKAKAHFESFPPGAQREYLEWITEAKKDETRDKRIEQAVEWIAEGKRRNWKYENC